MHFVRETRLKHGKGRQRQHVVETGLYAAEGDNCGKGEGSIGRRKAHNVDTKSNMLNTSQ